MTSEVIDRRAPVGDAGLVVEIETRVPVAAQLGVAVAEAGPERVVARLAWRAELCTARGRDATSTSHLLRAVSHGEVPAVATPAHRGPHRRGGTGRRRRRPGAPRRDDDPEPGRAGVP